MTGVPEIGVGWAMDDDGDPVVRLVVVINGAEQCVADLLPGDARSMAGALHAMADKVEESARAAAAQVANHRGFGR